MISTSFMVYHGSHISTSMNVSIKFLKLESNINNL